ncbi:DMT family transporter [Motiliproteus coralliicola]|uniref:DMT family transporter n=2 Tax=Motiliproteus coralliicola TaxID=2283196 RepID=A0A369WPZ2_9GAMM|nr:DMT family transporter [Motiliproteus coralliicola]
MMLAMAAFAVEDMLIKAAAGSVSTGFVLALFGLGGTLVFSLLCFRQRESLLHPALLSTPILIRAVCEVVGRLFFVLAITLSSLSSASTILQATPLVVVLGAALLFNEQVGLRRWLAIVLGFVGVLLVIRPGLGSFEPASILAVIGMVGFAGRDLATRAAPSELSNRQLGVYGFFILIPTGVGLHLYNGQPVLLDSATAGLIGAAVVCGVVAYNALTIAMRTGEVSVVAPFRYTRLIFALILAALFFAERPDVATLAGGLIIVLSGGYTLIYNRKLAAGSVKPI